MAKPWGRYEIGFLDHPKFLALNANALALWWEGKNYCDANLTDGLIPHTKVKTFRFRGAKSIDMLTTPVEKADGTRYAPLWEKHEVGYKMHDYLDHNDCREVVLARKGAAEERRQADKKRQAEWRAKNTERRANAKRHEAVTRDMSRNANASVTPYTEATTEAEPPPTPSRGSAFAKPDSVITDDALAERASRFLERYVQIYAKVRHGAHLQIRPAVDFTKALDLVNAYTDDAWLDGIAELFLTRDAWKPKNEPGTIGQLRHMAPQADAELRRHGWSPRSKAAS